MVLFLVHLLMLHNLRELIYHNSVGRGNPPHSYIGGYMKKKITNKVKVVKIGSVVHDEAKYKDLVSKGMDPEDALRLSQQRKV